MSSPKLSPSSVIASASAQQTGHQVTTVLPLRTISRLSVSIVILVVFATMRLSGQPIARRLIRNERILQRAGRKSLQCGVQYFSMNFKKRIEAADARSYAQVERRLPEEIQGVVATVGTLA